MRLLLDLFSVVSILIGMVFFLAGTVGLLRFPDTLSRLHALTKADNLGLGLVVLGLLAQADTFAYGIKLVLVWLLAQFASASAGQIIATVAQRERRQNRSGG